MLARKLTLIVLITVFIATALFSASPVKAATYTYTLHGPYYENNMVASGTANVTVLWVNGAIVNYQLTSSGGVAGSVTINSVNPLTSMSWNSTSINGTVTRIYDFTPNTPSDINIYISNPNQAYALYSFSVTDFAGMVNPFLQSSISPDGLNWYTVESRSLNGTSTVAFVMTQYQQYQLSFTCQQGTYSQQFLPETTFSTSLPVPAEIFPVTASLYPTFNVYRINSSMIITTYDDPLMQTNWLYLQITHQSGTLTVIDYTYNQTGNIQTLLWNNADPNKDYSIAAQASINGQVTSWTQPAPLVSNSNPWLGVFDFLGTNTNTMPNVYSGWPAGMTSYQIAQLIAVVIITVFLGMGSFRNAGASAIIACIMAGIMFAIGWWNGGVSQATISAVPELGLAFFVAIITHFSEKKAEGAGLS
jgi:hypothetical protein